MQRRLSKHEGKKAIYCHGDEKNFLRVVRTSKNLHTVDIRDMGRYEGSLILGLEVVPNLLSGPESVQCFKCSSVDKPDLIVELLAHYQNTLEELDISISNALLSYGEGGNCRAGIEPRPGLFLKLISEMKNLRVVRFAEIPDRRIYDQGPVDPKWYFGELQNPELRLEAIAMVIENPTSILLEKFIVPFFRSKIPFLEELLVTCNIWKNNEIQEMLKKCHNLKALIRFPVDCPYAYEVFLIDFAVGPWIKDFQNVSTGLSYVQEISLRIYDRGEPDTGLETFLLRLATSLYSCKRIHIFRRRLSLAPLPNNVHYSTTALAKFLSALCGTLEEVHLFDSFGDGEQFVQLREAIIESVPRLKCRGITANCFGTKGFLFSIRNASESVIPNTEVLRLATFLEHFSHECLKLY